MVWESPCGREESGEYVNNRSKGSKGEEVGGGVGGVCSWGLPLLVRVAPPDRCTKLEK